MNNPFKVGELVSGDPFCNRQTEINRLSNAFLDGQNIVMISPRRWGKSSLVKEAIRKTQDKALFIVIDCFGITSSNEFIEVYLTEMLKASANLYTKVADIVKRFAGSISPYISYSFGVNEEIKFSLNIPPKKLDPKVILEMGARIGKDKKIPVVICIDEFQKISEWENGDIFLELLRSVWQKHPGVSYCLYGSKRHLMTSMFNDSSKPFYRFGETIFLEKIEADEWVEFIIKQFTKTKKKVSRPVALKLVTLAEAHSYYVQYIARQAWAVTNIELTEKMLDSIYEDFLHEHVALFRMQTEGLTRYQINFIKALANGETKLTSAKVLKDFDLGSPGNIQRIEKALQDHEIIDLFSGEAKFNEPYFLPLFRRYFMRD